MAECDIPTILIGDGGPISVALGPYLDLAVAHSFMSRQLFDDRY